MMQKGMTNYGLNSPEDFMSEVMVPEAIFGKSGVQGVAEWFSGHPMQTFSERFAGDDVECDPQIALALDKIVKNIRWQIKLHHGVSKICFKKSMNRIHKLVRGDKFYVDV